MTRSGSYSTEYEFSPEGENPLARFVLDIDYDFTPEQPVRLHPWPGEPGHGAEVEMSADLFLLDGTQRIALPAEVKSWLLARIDLKQFVEPIIEQEVENAQSRADEAADRKRDEARDHAREAV